MIRAGIRRPAIWLALLLYGFDAIALADVIATSGNAHARIIAAAGNTHIFRIEVAAEPAQRRKGLSFRHHLDEDAGMLFIYDRPAERTFWMRNTFIPLDIIFIDPQDRIHKIHSHAVPMSDDRISSEGQVDRVLEINGGLSERLGIAVGDRIEIN